MVFPDSFMFDNWRKNRPQIFFIRRFPFFPQKLDFSSTSMVLKNWSYYFHSICRNTCLTFTIRPLRFVTLEITRKKRRRNFLFTVKFAFLFSKICDFNNLLGLKKCTGKLYSVGKTSFRTLVSFSLRFIIFSIKREKWAKVFGTWKQLVFELFVSIDL